MKRMKKITVLGTTVLFMFGLCACGTATMRINDNGTVTEIETSTPSTVEKILKDAEIVLKEGDEVSPSLDTKISEEQEIVVSRKHTIKLTTDGKTKEVSMTGGTVSDLLKQEDITLGEKQHVNYGLDEYLKDDMEIKISYSYSIKLQCDGKTKTHETEAETVKDALEELGITLGKDDRVTPAASEKLTEDMEIVVNRVTFDTVVEKEEIGYETAYEDDSSLPKGEEQVSTKGENGVKEISYKVTYVDGVEESKEAENEKVTKEPVNKVVKVGTKEEAPPVIEEEPPAVEEAPPVVEEAPPVVEEAPPVTEEAPPERTVISKKAYYDCNDSSHGYYEITYSDGSVEYEEF